MSEFWKTISKLPFPRTISCTRTYNYDRTIRISYTTDLVHEYRFNMIYGKILCENVDLFVNGRFITKMNSLDNIEPLIILLNSIIVNPDDWTYAYDEFVSNITKKKTCMVQ